MSQQQARVLYPIPHVPSVNAALHVLETAISVVETTPSDTPLTARLFSPDLALARDYLVEFKMRSRNKAGTLAGYIWRACQFRVTGGVVVLIGTADLIATEVSELAVAGVFATDGTDIQWTITGIAATPIDHFGRGTVIHGGAV
jgi:hypothetical protein